MTSQNQEIDNKICEFLEKFGIRFVESGVFYKGFMYCEYISRCEKYHMRLFYDECVQKIYHPTSNISDIYFDIIIFPIDKDFEPGLRFNKIKLCEPYNVKLSIQKHGFDEQLNRNCTYFEQSQINLIEFNEFHQYQDEIINVHHETLCWMKKMFIGNKLSIKRAKK